MKKTLVRLFLLGCFLTSISHSLRAGGLTSEVRLFRGLPALYVNGRLTSPLLCFTSRSQDLRDFLEAGFRIVDFSVPFGWVGPEQYDFSRTDATIEEYLKQDPHLLILPRIEITPGEWWCTAFPEEITLRGDGSRVQFHAPCHPSFASEKYRELSSQALRAFLRHMEGKYGDRVVGYFPGNGVYGEWLSWNAYWEVPEGQPPPNEFGVEDYSVPAQAAFRRWLKGKYHDRMEELRRAWGNSAVTFETARTPPEAVRKQPTHGIFLDPSISRQVPDYFEFFNNLVSDVLLKQCHTTKAAIGRRKIVGVFYGYLWCNYPHLSLNHSGHLGFAKVLRSPDVDFIASPYSYDNRGVGGADNAQTLPETIAHHGKLYINEVDTETHLQQRQWRWGKSLRNPANFEETRGLLIRDFGYAFTKGFGMWFMDLLGGMFHDPQIVQLFSDLRAVDEKYLQADKRQNCEVAVVLDEDSFNYFSDGEILFTALLNVQKQWHLAFLGAPFDTLLLSDLGDPGLRDYKLYIFLNTFHVPARQRSELHARFRRNGATAVWVYAPGYIEQGLSVENMRALTGIKLAETDMPGELRVEVTSYDHPYTRDLPRGFAYGTDVDVGSIEPFFDHRLYLKDPSDATLRRTLPGFRISPRFWGDDPAATVLGQLVGPGKPGLLVKAQRGWTSVYSSAPILPAALLRNIATQAGCHIYTDGNDVVYANRNFLVLYSPHGGQRIVRLPRAGRVTDLLEGRVLSSDQLSFTLAIPQNSAKILGIE